MLPARVRSSLATYSMIASGCAFTIQCMQQAGPHVCNWPASISDVPISRNAKWNLLRTVFVLYLIFIVSYRTCVHGADAGSVHPPIDSCPFIFVHNESVIAINCRVTQCHALLNIAMQKTEYPESIRGPGVVESIQKLVNSITLWILPEADKGAEVAQKRKEK